MPSGIVIEVRPLYANALAPIEDSPAGSRMDSKLEQARKARSPIVVIVLGKSMYNKLLQPANATSPIVITEAEDVRRDGNFQLVFS